MPSSRAASWRASRGVVVVVEQDAGGVARRVVVLAAPHRPPKGAEADQCDQQRQRGEDEDDGHLRPAQVMRSAFSITASDEADMAMAATNGLTSPRIATGAATKL